MPDLIFEHDRQFPTTHLSDELILVVPDALAEADAIRRVQDALTGPGGQKPDLVPQRYFIDERYQQAHVIACGHMGNNTVIERLYTKRCCFVDTFFPGPGGIFIKSVSDPFGYGKNCITLGASTDEDLLQALSVFENMIQINQGDLSRVHMQQFSHELPPYPDPSELEEMIQSQLAIWGGGWSASPFRGGGLQQFLWHYYLTDHEVWGRAIPPIFAGSIGPWRAERRDYPESYHCFFNLHSFIHLWDLVEDSPLYTQNDRHQVVTMFGELLDHLAGLFYLKPEVNPPEEPRQNHSTFISLNLAVGHDYMVKRYGIQAFDHSVEPVERIFDGQAESYKPNDDAGVGYAWHVPQETLYYMLYKNDYRYIDEGHVADLCRLAVVTTDNMRSEGGYGDTAGYAAFSTDAWNGYLWPLMVSTWRTHNPKHLWTLNWLGEGKRPTLGQVLSGLYSAVDFSSQGFELEGCTPETPLDLLGINAMPLPENALRWVQHRTSPPFQPDPTQTYFDKVALRSSFETQDEYLLLEGTGTFCHGHEDTNAIIRLTWHNRAWLADGDYIRAAPKFHNAVTVTRDGVGVLHSPGEGLTIPPLATIQAKHDGPQMGLLQTETAHYNGMDWRRNIFWRKGRFFVVMDQLHCTVTGDYHCRCLWRLVGDVQQDGTQTRLSQKGEDFFITNVDRAVQHIEADHDEGGQWPTYPYADKPLHILHQKHSRAIQPEQDLVFTNLLTPYENIRIERLNDHMVKITDGENITVLGTGNASLGAATVESKLFAISLTDDAVTIQGIDRIGYSNREEMTWETFDGSHHLIDAISSPLARHLKTVLPIQGHRPVMRQYRIPTVPDGGMQIAWTRDITETDITDISISEELIVAGTENGQVLQLSTGNGESIWERQIEQPISTMLQVRLNENERPDIFVGTGDSDLILLNGEDGTEQWRHEMQNMSGRGARVSEIAVADLDGTGQSSVLAGTAGWYVNALTTAGEPLWANWIRYHPITTLRVADVDHDGKAEVMVGNVYSTPLSVHNFDGSFRWSTLEQVGSEGNATTPRRGIHLTQMCLVDVDHDGIDEIVYGTADGWIYAVKPQDGAEVWHLNLVGEVTGLLTATDGFVATNEFGGLYGIGYDGQIAWQAHDVHAISHLAMVGEHLIVSTQNRLLRYDLQSVCTGSLTLEHTIHGIHACADGVICNLAGGQLTKVVLH